MTTSAVYTITLMTLDPFRVGGKEDPLSEADNPVAVVGSRLCIPGPSLKGALRAELERWLFQQFNVSGQWKNNALAPCIPATTERALSADERRLRDQGRFGGLACTYKAGDGRPRRDEPPPKTTICPACYLLGAMGLVGFVHVPFLFAGERVEALYSARLDRATQVVASGANRSYQLVPPETRFTGTLDVLLQDDYLSWELGKPRPLRENPQADAWLDASWNQQRVLDDLLLGRLRAIGRLGGYRSKGFGRVKIEVTPQAGQ